MRVVVSPRVVLSSCLLFVLAAVPGLVPEAAAQDPNPIPPYAEGPHTTDPAGDAGGVAALDMTEAWFALEDGELVARWQVASLPNAAALPADACFNLDFYVDGGPYWVLFASRDGKTLYATVRNYQTGFEDENVQTGTHPVTDGRIDVEITYGSPATFTVRYDSGAFPLAAGATTQFSENAYSCTFDAGQSVVDRVTPAAPFLLPSATWRPLATHTVYEGAALFGAAALDWCQTRNIGPAGAKCVHIAAADRGAAYTFTSTPPILVSNTAASPTVTMTFHDDSGRFTIYGEPGGFPRRATAVSVAALVPMQWRIETT